ncbi:hypothetical protein F5B19DRAFT_493663 [Rostrohypoxylon terebratum]|nr:hypothetical protein F5B19DRAFT_493663 [Rostrohypoxylon terebratum]
MPDSFCKQDEDLHDKDQLRYFQNIEWSLAYMSAVTNITANFRILLGLRQRGNNTT